MNDTTAVLISFLRPEYTKECVRSLREMYPDIHILVAENAEFNQDLADYVSQYGGKYFLMPFDSGVCYARNRLVELVTTEYVLVGDDDFFYTPEAKVPEMAEFLRNHKEVSLIGGRIFENNKVLNYQGTIDLYPDHFHYKPLDEELNKYDKASGISYQITDITFNFFVARVNEIRHIKWDEQIKVAFEHSDWFISLKKAGVTVAYTPDAIVVHKPEHIKRLFANSEQQKTYSGYRMRRSDKVYFFKKHAVDYSIGFRGTVTVVKEEIEQAKQHGDMFYAPRRMCFDGKEYNEGDIIRTKRPTPELIPIY